MQIGWYTHVPKTGGTTLYNLLERDQCSIASTCHASVGPRGAFVVTPLQLHALGLSPSSWHAICRRDHAKPDVIRVGNTSRACSEDGWSPINRSTAFRSSCHSNLHWPALISLQLSMMLSRAGLVPVLVAGVRSPFAYYPSHYIYALTRQRRDGLSGGLGWLGPEHDVCWRNGSSGLSSFVSSNSSTARACRAAFQSHVQGRLNQSAGFERSITAFVGDVNQRTVLVPRWAWLRTELLSEDLRRVYERLTGLSFPSTQGCLLSNRTPSCYGAMYDGASPSLLQGLREHDAWVFSYFGYPLSPGDRCLPLAATDT